MRHSNVCYHHGAMTPSGIASPNFKTGEWAKDLPTRMQTRALAALADAELLSQKKAVAILDARFWDVVGHASKKESGEHSKALYEALMMHDNARGKDAEDTRSRAMQTIRTLIVEGFNERAAWQEARDIIQEMRMVRESEQKSIINKQQSLSMTEAMVMLGHVTFAIKDAVSEVSNPDERKRVLDKVSRSIAALVDAPTR